VAKKKTGRPTKYRPDMPDRVREYIKNHEALGDVIPTIAGFACEAHVNKDTLYEWAAGHPRFSDALDELRYIQERKLLSGGLEGSYNPTIAKLILATNHGYKERTDITTNDEPIGAPMIVLPELPKPVESKVRRGAFEASKTIGALPEPVKEAQALAEAQ